MKTIIVAGGEPPSKKLLTKELTKDSVIIAADSGADCLLKYKITPDYLIGDLDSISKKTLRFFTNKEVTIEKHSIEKNFTDAELALKKAIKFKPKEIIFLGAIGGKRIDHFLGALGLLDKCLSKNIEASLKDDYQTITLIKKSAMISGKPGDIFSLQAFGAPVKGLTITGSKYTINNHTLKMGAGLTLANEFHDKKVNIRFKSGKILVISKKNKEGRP